MARCPKKKPGRASKILGNLTAGADICTSELAKSIVNGIGIGFLSCIGIGIGIVKTIFQVLVLVLLRGFPNYWYWYC